ncbi:DUF1775 domain-containing protein [Streptomyces sp. NPDC051776]|uniref:DUF1775 domain-containing protein n=1 Tax=Streptomyces sp. NPDC051776 TaxID=3155414 RepID=UPI003420933F
MSRTTRARWARRLVVMAAAALSATLAVAAPASAHVEVSADRPQALAENVSLTFVAEAESTSAGISEIEVFLPSGIAPEDVGFGKGPKGWKMTRTAHGYVVSGPALTLGQDVRYTVTVRQLPEADSVSFKTLQRYDDGRVDRWIELGKPGGGHGHSHDHGEGNSVAPSLKLKPAAPGAEPRSPDSGTPTSAAPPRDDGSGPASLPGEDKGKGNTAAPTLEQDAPSALYVVLAGVLVVAAGGVWWWNCRRGGDIR